ncbi:hypothetical protein RB596_007080 [Gaeumannomyces avenae]
MSNTAHHAHTYGTECRLAPVAPLPDDYRDDDGHDDDYGAATERIPPINAQFFYSSLIPIQDSPSSAASDARGSSAQSQRPFSEADNNALERAWLSLASDTHRRAHSRAQRNRSPSLSESSRDAATLAAIYRRLIEKHSLRHQQDAAPFSVSNSPTATPACCPELRTDAASELRGTFCVLTRRRLGMDSEAVVATVMAELGKASPTNTGGQTEARSRSEQLSPTAATGARPSMLPATRIGRTGSRVKATDAANSSRARASCNTLATTTVQPGPPPPDDGISGKPFVKIGSPGTEDTAISPPNATPPKPRTATVVTNTPNDNQAEPWEPARAVQVPVGSRLYLVSFPEMQMRPMYWSPINDVTVVTRATWFYRDNMTPVEPKVANQLEAGYSELRPWSEAWSIEIRCAIAVGALGEEKVSQPLWGHPPAGTNANVEDMLPVEPGISDDPYCAARCYRGNAAAVGVLSPHVGETTDTGSTGSYPNWHVVYKNATEANLLKPSLRPSAYYSRTPISRIMKGATVGIPVVRGFNRDAWRRIHERPRGASDKGASHPLTKAVATAEARPRSRPLGPSCTACAAETENWRDLVLVIHGIGQKFAERVESFHFTHAINSFRRAVNTELGSNNYRDAAGGIMVLPVNWRHLLSFEDGGTMQQGGAGAAAAPESFGLKDIEPKTIPVVRGLISDVMFDVPYYLSHHKPRMIKAVTREANRIYRLWCKNNPGFADQGRVHLIAHSLGSVMALDILSNQPTITPPLRDPTCEADPDARHFEFDCKNLFLLGSPAAFFLLLERSQLVPREGRLKPGTDPADVTSKDIVGQQGQFGCLAVDNIYNILSREDPVAYLLNSTIDPVYAASLKKTFVPTTATFFQSIGNGIRGLWGGAPTQPGAGTAPNKPPTVRLPSQLELEVHDFTREEIAERKAILLNDNGTLDYYLHSSGGPLEIQYLNMLHAHSSYWTSPDLIRMLCMEICRKPGRAYIYEGLRATKAAKRLVPRTPS